MRSTTPQPIPNRHYLLEKPMKTIFAISFASLFFMAGPTYATCTNIKHTYRGDVPAHSEVIAHGPFTITSTSGCQQAHIASTIAPSGPGTPPQLFIDRLEGSTWQQITGGNQRSASLVGRFGTYRVRHVNSLNASISYSGTTRYSR